ncbi:MAG: family 78 glycoside hydrolase catalytic domain, partial [Kiritimatiellae bacterium]|nr:family 78 glycoside hydrolase catalytic domain [Kiritimatiellia bacterium]
YAMLKETFIASALAAAAVAAPAPDKVPELMRTFAGAETKTLAEWEKVRAPELLARFEKEVYGRRPAAANERDRVSFEVYDIRDAMGGMAVRKLVRVTYKGPNGTFTFPFTAYIPKKTVPVPAFIFAANIPRSAVGTKQEISSDFWPVEEIVARGYATAAFRFDTVAADRKGAGFSQGVFPSVQPENERDAESWATLSAWAWADSRLLDWMETEPLIDAGRVGVVGHSRGGKTAILAGVTDKRFAMICSNDSGCSGAKLNHMDLPGSESIAVITKAFPYWFCGNYRKYAGKDREMDFDQHELLALLAPRLLCVASATEDHWAGPAGEWRAAKLASPAWELYGKKGLAADAMPEPDAPQQEGCVSYHLRTGKHFLSPYDWKCYMDFADRHGWRDCAAASDAEPVALTVDRRAEAANVGSRPSFAWQMKCARQGAAQTAYRILVIEQGGGVAWDSGEVADSRSTGIVYAGSPLSSAKRYVWRVSVKDDKGKWADSAFAHFTTGLLSDGEWKGALWISAQGDAAKGPGTACFTRAIANKKPLREAYWTVTGLGVFEAYVNGNAVSSPDFFTNGRVHDFLKPGFTHNGKRKHAFTYDVTRLMNWWPGASNVFSAEVSASWWRDKMTLRMGKKKSAFRAQLVLRYADGTEERIGTDAKWLAAMAGPVKEAGIYEGETCDAREATPWRTSAKRLAGFGPAEANKEFGGATLPMDGPATSLRRDLALAPKEMYVWNGVEGATSNAFGKVKIVRRCEDGKPFTLDAGETLVIDFGQNAAAVPEFQFSAKAGTAIKARPAEMLNDGNGARARGCDGPEGSAYFANYRSARTTMKYVFAGRKRESYHPSFTFFGYRYLSVTATGKVTIFSARSLPVTSIARGDETGTLETGVADVNKLVSNVLWGQYSNYLSVPTDCPQRNERQGWTADTQVFTKAASYNADAYGFLCKWLADVRDSQGADGAIPGIAPIPGPRNDGCRHGWADAVVIVPYTLWRHFGDLRAVEENWKAMEKYVGLIARTRFDTPKDRGYQWADWLSYEKYETHRHDSWNRTPDGKRLPKPETQDYWLYLGGCYWLWDARMMEDMARATGRTDDARKYGAMAAEALAYLRGRFVDKNGGMLIPSFRNMQTPALFALKLGVVAGEAAGKTRDELLANVKSHGDCLQTGFLGTSILMDTMTYQASSPETAYTLLLQHKNPSWLYSVDQGATTIWERWNSYTKATGFGSAGMNSFNHYAYGAVLAWMYGTMAGIQSDPEAGGFKKFVLAPIPDKRMGRVKAAYRSPYGTIRSEWRYEGGEWKWTFTIPANTSATVTPPGGKAKVYAAGTYSLSIPDAGSGPTAKKLVLSDESRGLVHYFDADDASKRFSVPAEKPVWDLQAAGARQPGKIGRYRYVCRSGFKVVDMDERKDVDEFRHPSLNGVTAVSILPDGGFLACVNPHRRKGEKAVLLRKFSKDRSLLATYTFRGIYNARMMTLLTDGDVLIAHETGFTRGRL